MLLYTLCWRLFIARRGGQIGDCASGNVLGTAYVGTARSSSHLLSSCRIGLTAPQRRAYSVPCHQPLPGDLDPR